AHLRVGATVDPALRPVLRAELAIVTQVAVVAEREPPGRVVERLRVRSGQGRELGGPAQVHERSDRLGRADRLATRVVAEGPDIPVRGEPAVGSEPGGAPAEARDAEPLEPLGEWPELVEPER